jgi:cell fate regulator YaaT (PSP1 superfamily)
MTVFDWLEGVALPTGQTAFDVVEVRFKANRKGFFRRSGGLDVQVGDVIAVESDRGHDIGVVSLRGELVRAQMSAKKVRDDHELKKVLRKATQEDVDLWQKARLREGETMIKSREIIQRLGLRMKLSDVEFQGDGKKVTYYYTSDDRVDFRDLVRELAGAFAVRVEMRQIGARQEAARVGGIGVCGRELCCASWLTDFRSVSTSAARYQQLSLNPQKLAGQCGKLKCCLNFELDQYVESVKEFPSPNAKIKMKEGRAVVFKMDIFKKLVYLLHLDAPASSPVPVSLDDMKELMAMNERGEYPHSLSEFALQEEPDEVDTVYSNVVGQDSLTRFDEQRQKRRKKGGRSGSGGNRNRSNAPKNRDRSEGGAKAKTPADGARQKSGGSKPPANGGGGQNRGRGRSRGGDSAPSQPNNQNKKG